jgi:hypothetical protein
VTLASPASPSPELAPRLHVKAPSHLTHILEEFDEGVRVDAPNTALRALRQAFALLLGLSTDLVGAACVQMGASADLFILPEGDSVRLAEAEGRLKEGLYFLSQRESALGQALARVFFDETGTPRQFYLLTQGGKVEGMMGGLLRISDFAKEPRRAPGRSESFKLRNLYLPHLEAWLQSLNKLWDQAEVLWERTDLRGQQRIRYQLFDTELEVGHRIELQECKACIPSRVLRAPDGWVSGEPYLGVPQDVPEHTLHLADRFGEALQQNDVIESTRLLRDTLEFLLRYFAGVGKTLCEELQCLNDEAQRAARNTESVDNCERLLQATVESLKSHQDDVAARELVGVFYRRDANLDLQPRSHTNILLLEGVLSSWFKQERGRQPSEERYAKDFERYFPLFRDWVRSMGPYFSHTEHFSETPTPQGQLPLTTRCGEHLLELTENNYLLRIRQCPVCLPNPEWTVTPQEPKPVTEKLSAEQLLRRANKKDDGEPAPAPVVETAPEPVVVKTFPGEFRPISLPADAPKFLGRVLRRLDVRLRRGELPESSAALRDALDYLLRYWAGVCAACARASNKLNAEDQKLAASSLSAHECEKLLNSTLKTLAEGVNELSEEIVQVFYHRDLFTNEMKPLGGHTRMLMTDISSDNQMQLLAEFCDRRELPDLHQARRDLKMFLPVLRDWLDKSQGFFDQCLHHEEDPDNDGRMELVVQWDKDYLELVAPDYAFYVRPGADEVPDLEVPEYVEPAPETQTVDAAPKPRIITTEELALQEPFLMHRVQYIGMQPNSQGVPCRSGIIAIQNAGGGSLTGRAYSNHPCIEVNPNRFRDKTQLTYWLDESSLPRDFVPVLTLRSGGDERQITLAEMRPLSKLNTMSKGQALVLTWAPPVGGFLLVSAVAVNRAHAIRKHIGDLRGKLKEIAPDVLQLSKAEGDYVGSALLIYAAFSAVATMTVYRRFSHSLQDLLHRQFLRALLAPLVGSALVVLINAAIFPELRNPEIASANLPSLLVWALVFGAAGAAYSYLEQTNRFAEWVQEPALRKVIPVVCFGTFLLLWTLALT